MVIYVSDSGIFRTDSTYPTANTAPVNKVSPLKPTDSATESVVRDAQKAYVAETTPAYTVNISSMGKAAVKSMKTLAEDMNKNQISADNKITTNISGLNSINDKSNSKKTEEKSAIYETSVDYNNNISVQAQSVSEPDEAEESAEEVDVTASSSVNTNNLSRYTDYQLQQMLDDGTITRSEYNSEIEKRSGSTSDIIGTQPMDEAMKAAQQDPVMKQAVAAYNFQMAYQINAAITQ